jgi:hypothetical protein
MEEQKQVDEVREEESLEVEYTTRIDYISAAFYSISAVEGIDLLLLTKEESRKIKRILKKSVRIIESCISEMYDELFDEDKDEE